jgi:molybdopterin synthase catalytic subunit
MHHARGSVSLVERAIDTGALVASVADVDAGANVLFVGTTRRRTGGAVTERLEYEAHAPMASELLEGLRRTAAERFDLLGCGIVHRLGVVGPGEASVAVATAAPHRREAFAAAEWLMEEIKRGVPIWKCDESDGGVKRWVHPQTAPAGDDGSRT